MGKSVERFERFTRALTVAGTALALVVTSAVASVVTAAPAQADVSPPAGTPATFTAGYLPTAQMNGVAWDQAVVGDTVFVGGDFQKARPAGSALGTNEVARPYLLSYTLSTGVLTSFAPTLNGQVRQVAVSPDGSRLYIVGDFTTVNGVTRNRAAAFDLPSLTLSSWNPNLNAATLGVEATDSTVYMVGTFGRAAGADRAGAAAVTRDGALLPWAPVLAGGTGRVVISNPDASRVVVGGNFKTVNGSSNPGYGLAMVDGTTGTTLLPFATNSVIRNAGSGTAITSLKSDGESVYGTGITYGGGNLEGTFRASWATGDLVWVADCHGDEYDVQPMGDAIYSVGHPHYCGTLSNGFPQTDPWSFHRAIAFSKDAVRTTPYGLGLGYFDFGGNAAPEQLHFFPTFNMGTFTNQNQGPWTVNGNGDYLVYGGEFTTVNGVAQQGLARLASTTVSPGKEGPRLGGNAWVPTTTPFSQGGLRVSWPSNIDRDSEYLTYEVLRDDTVIATLPNRRSKSADYALPDFAFVDYGGTPGVTYSYRVRAKDAQGNSIVSARTNGTATATGSSNAYRDTVLADKPLHLWTFDETNGSTIRDMAGRDDLTANNWVALNKPSATGSGTSADFSSIWGATTGSTVMSAAPNTFGVEAWIKTTSRSGGKIIGYGSRNSGTSSNNDRHIYMRSDGRISFGVFYRGARQIVTSAAAYNDGQWHQVAAGLDNDGIALYVDGVLVASQAGPLTGEAYSGYWRVGGDAAWPNSDVYFDGQIDEVAVYDRPLTSSQLRSHIAASGRTTATSSAPTDAYGAAVYGLNPSAYWRLNETTGTVAADSGGAAQPATYVGSATRGVTGALAGVPDAAVRLTGGQIISTTPQTNPTSFATEAWFQTTSTTGGKIIGFGDSATGLSANYDRGVHMRPDGTLVFGVLTTLPTTLATTTAYNDGAWHHVVASQGLSGMKLYVDGVLVGQNTEKRSVSYLGYWHVGGDRAVGITATTFAGAIDEAAVYGRPLTDAEVALHYSLGATGLLPNTLPTALATSSVRKLALTVDGSTSADSDGNIVSYAWDFGDGATATGVTATHDYAAAGRYTVTLTVTDDRGGVATKTMTVDAVANQAPAPVITSTVSGLSVSADASTSTDGDGTIAAYAWDFGDGATATGATATHAYATDGTYTVTLTVTDDDGAASTTTADVTVTTPIAARTFASDAFNRSLASGLGSADLGGAWTLSNSATNYRVDGASAVFLQQSGGAQRFAYLADVSSTDTAVQTSVTLPQRPAGASAYASVIARRVGTQDYTARLVVSTTGAVTLQLQRAGTVLATQNTGLTVDGGTPVKMRVEATGTNPTTLRAKVWTTTEPQAWTATTTDATAALQAPGHIGLGVYLGAGATNVPFQTTFDDLWVGSTTATPNVNVAPTAAFTATGAGLTASVDASASTDADGTIASYAWDFGDGATGSGASAQHAYAAAGTYTVTLTVTDDAGATATTTSAVTVVAPAHDNVAPTASFTSTTADLSASFDATASTDADGTIGSYAWDFGDGATGSGANAQHVYAAAGTYTVTLTVTDDAGATGTTVSTVTVTDPPVVSPLFAQDDFNRANGLVGSALVGGAWSGATNAANVGIVDNRLKLSTTAAGQTRTASLPGASSDSTDLTFSFSTSDAVTGTARLYVSAIGRTVGADDYRARWLIGSGGSVQAQLTRGGTALASKNLTDVTITPGAIYNVRLQVFGTGTTTLRSKIWPAGTTEPVDWQQTTTDATAALQVAGGVGVSTYAGTGITPATLGVFVDDVAAQKVAP